MAVDRILYIPVRVFKIGQGRVAAPKRAILRAGRALLLL